MIGATMDGTLERWNRCNAEQAEAEVLPCCGSRAWARAMTARRPLVEEAEVLRAASEVWRELPEKAWMEAFASHPRIGEREAPQSATRRSAAWSTEEQRTAMLGEACVQQELRRLNEEYERRFGRVFLICAAGRSAQEIAAELERRMTNEPRAELVEAAEQQRQITALRLTRWMEAR